MAHASASRSWSSIALDGLVSRAPRKMHGNGLGTRQYKSDVMAGRVAGPGRAMRQRLSRGRHLHCPRSRTSRMSFGSLESDSATGFALSGPAAPYLRKPSARDGLCPLPCRGLDRGKVSEAMRASSRIKTAPKAVVSGGLRWRFCWRAGSDTEARILLEAKLRAPRRRGSSRCRGSYFASRS